jgi:hypothetical protein
MKAERKNKIILITVCLINVFLAHSQTKIDTISCFKNIVIEYPSINRINKVNYEEGFFKSILCVKDTVGITIHCGAMVNLPLTDLTNKTICSKFLLGKDIRSIRGYYMFNGRKKYFREDNYFEYGITVVYENVDETKLILYEYFFNNIKIQ